MARLLAALCALLLLVLAGTAEAATPQIQAHRGGSVTFGTPTYPENTLPGFERAARNGFVVEWDVKLTKDGVPIVIHDDSLDRTTPCTGLVKDFLLQTIETQCRSDVLGAPGSSAQSSFTTPKVPLPSLRQALAVMKRLGATVSLEIKNIPTDRDWDQDSGYFANRVIGAIIESGFPLDHLIIQSFWPPNLTFVRARLPHVRTSQLLTAGTSIDRAIQIGQTTHATYLSPSWPIDAEYVKKAHRLGFLVVPYTIDQADQFLTAAMIGVDALITNDPFYARQVLTGP